MRGDYERWLRGRGYGQRFIGNQISYLRRVERHYGDLDGHYDGDRCRGLIAALAYSAEDERHGRPNPTKIPFVGDSRENLASYKSSVLSYVRFRGAGAGDAIVLPTSESSAVAVSAAPAIPRAPRRSAAQPVLPSRLGERTLADFRLDGRAALEAIIASSQYRTIAQAVASLTLFSHPDTVRQTGGKPLFQSVRDPKRVGQIDTREGRLVLLDDNKSPTDAFLWGNGLSRRGADVQFNHVYRVSSDVDAYTALPNICMTPAFLAKLTDTSAEILSLLSYRSHQLYGWFPNGHSAPERPAEYEVLEWAAPLPPVDDVRAALERAMASKPKDRTVIAARRLGWLFGEASASSCVAAAPGHQGPDASSPAFP